jgi:ribosomal protein S18 acetylase RimI-like enzyme
MQIKQLPNQELSRLAEIDRTEEIPQAYVVRDGELVLQDVRWRADPWPLEGEYYSIQHYVEWLTPILDNGAVLLGALDGEKLAGLAVLDCKLTETMAQLTFLHVSREYRSQGVGKALTQEMFRLARKYGATHIYVSSIPTKNSVDFYRNQGFRLTKTPHPELFALEPEDIHMVCQL